MSFVRYGQEGTYVDIPGGSAYYIYGNGRDISGWSKAQFAALIGGVVDELPDDAFVETTREDIREGFTQHFGGWDSEYRGGITPPERAEIFCQCLDSRISTLDLSEPLHTSVKDWAASFDAHRECEYCGDEFRPSIYADDSRYVCPTEECRLKRDADNYGISVEDARRSEVVMAEVDFDSGWEFIVEHSTRDDLSP